MASNKRDLKMYIRYDGNGRIIPGSNIWLNKAPKGKNWIEMEANECCNFTITTTTTAWPKEQECYTIILSCTRIGGTATFGVYPCNEEPKTVIISNPNPSEVCCYDFPVLLSGSGSWTLGEICSS